MSGRIARTLGGDWAETAVLGGFIGVADVCKQRLAGLPGASVWIAGTPGAMWPCERSTPALKAGRVRKGPKPAWFTLSPHFGKAGASPLVGSTIPLSRTHSSCPSAQSAEFAPRRHPMHHVLNRSTHVCDAAGSTFRAFDAVLRRRTRGHRPWPARRAVPGASGG
jgi:hypothetical protein